jgi:deoxycytidine triphosphate deaminase
MPSIKADKWIKRMALEHGMIEPFEDRQVRQGVISYGLSSYGYDIRVADEFKVFTNINNTVVDPKNFDDRSFVDMRTEICIIPPNSFALARTVEYFRIPRDVLTVCVGKSTYARCGLIVNVTPFEPEWEGFDAGDLEYDAAAGAGLRPRGDRAGAVLPERRDVRGLLRRQEGQVPEAAGADAAEAVAEAVAGGGRSSAAAGEEQSGGSRIRDGADVHMLRAYKSIRPTIDPTAFVDVSAQVIGDVHVGAESSIWMNVVVRGDVHSIRIGRRSNIQDLTLVHVMRDTNPTAIGDNVTVGHSAVIHGCTIEDRCLIGMGAILLNGCRIGTGSIVAAGSLVPEGMVVPPGSMVMGLPARVKRPLTPDEDASILWYADNYVNYRLDFQHESSLD